nr:hypothetical protein [Acidobacteriota bacterium]
MKLIKINKFFASILILQLMAITSVCQTRQTLSEVKPKTSDLPQTINVEKPVTYQINPKDLPKPFATTSARRSSSIVAQPTDAKLLMPKGFKISVYAEDGFTYPRWMTLAPNGDVFVA